MRAPLRRGRVALAIIAALWLTQPPSAGAERAGAGAELAGSTDTTLGADHAADQARRRRHRWGGFQGGHAAPEIDPGLLAGGLALLAGGTLVLLGQRRTRHAAAMTHS